MSSPSRLNYEWLEMIAGRVWDAYPNFTSDTDVDPATIQAVLEFRTQPTSDAGTRIVSCATTVPGGAEGTITVTQIDADEEGGVWLYEAHCHLSAAATSALTPVLRGQAGWGDLKLYAPSVDGGEPQNGGRYQLRVLKEITA